MFESLVSTPAEEQVRQIVAETPWRVSQEDPRGLRMVDAIIRLAEPCSYVVDATPRSLDDAMRIVSEHNAALGKWWISLRKSGPGGTGMSERNGPFEGKRAVFTTKITQGTRDLLEKASKESGRSLSQEIELRLCLSLTEDLFMSRFEQWLEEHGPN